MAKIVRYKFMSDSQLQQLSEHERKNYKKALKRGEVSFPHRPDHGAGLTGLNAKAYKKAEKEQKKRPSKSFIRYLSPSDIAAIKDKDERNAYIESISTKDKGHLDKTYTRSILKTWIDSAKSEKNNKNKEYGESYTSYEHDYVWRIRNRSSRIGSKIATSTEKTSTEAYGPNNQPGLAMVLNGQARVFLGAEESNFTAKGAAVSLAELHNQEEKLRTKNPFAWLEEKQIDTIIYNWIPDDKLDSMNMYVSKVLSEPYADKKARNDFLKTSIQIRDEIAKRRIWKAEQKRQRQLEQDFDLKQEYMDKLRDCYENGGNIYINGKQVRLPGLREINKQAADRSVKSVSLGLAGMTLGGVGAFIAIGLSAAPIIPVAALAFSAISAAASIIVPVILNRRAEKKLEKTYHKILFDENGLYNTLDKQLTDDEMRTLGMSEEQINRYKAQRPYMSRDKDMKKWNAFIETISKDPLAIAKLMPDYENLKGDALVDRLNEIRSNLAKNSNFYKSIIPQSPNDVMTPQGEQMWQHFDELKTSKQAVDALHKCDRIADKSKRDAEYKAYNENASYNYEGIHYDAQELFISRDEETGMYYRKGMEAEVEAERQKMREEAAKKAQKEAQSQAEVAPQEESPANNGPTETTPDAPLRVDDLVDQDKIERELEEEEQKRKEAQAQREKAEQEAAKQQSQEKTDGEEAEEGSNPNGSGTASKDEGKESTAH